MSVCLMITFESLDVGSSYLHVRYISRSSGQGQGRRSKKVDDRSYMFDHINYTSIMTKHVLKNRKKFAGA